jgi:hypothetical protein
MDRMMVAAAIGMAIVFGTGIVVGVIVMVSVAIRAQDRRGSLTRQTPDAMACSARRLNGGGLRDTSPLDAGKTRR